jgi:hypothetical protein
MSHTPGPWTYKTWRHTDGASGTDVYAGEAWVACIHDSHGTTEGFPKDAEMVPNARVIAAAPELLKALQAVIETNAVRHNNSEFLIGLVSDARAAIAKATGGAA